MTIAKLLPSSLYVSLCFFLSSTLLFSQEEKSGCTCRVLFLERGESDPKSAYLFDGIKNHSVKFSGMNLSDPITLSEGATAIAMTPRKVIEPATLPSGSPRAKIPRKAKELYIIVASDKENKTFPVKLFVVNSSDTKFRSGETMWINLSKNIVAGKLNDKSFTVAPGKKLVTSPPMEKAGYIKTVFAYKPVGKDKYAPIMRKTWWFDPKSKYLGFIINRGGRLPKIFTFRDRFFKVEEATEEEPDEPNE